VAEPLRVDGGKFAAETTAQLGAVRAKLADVDRQLADISGKVPHAALRVTLGNPEPGDQEVLDHQADLERQLHVLRQAESAALRMEEDRKSAVAYQSDAARHRALLQHLSRMHKASMRFSTASENANSALCEMLDAGRAAFAVMPPSMQRNHSGPVSPSYLARLARAEIGRLDANNPLDARLFQHAPWVQDLRRGNGWITLVGLIQEHTENLKDMAEKLALPDPAAEPPETALVVAEPAPAPIVKPTPLDRILENASKPRSSQTAADLDLSVNRSSVPFARRAG
jgi:hypothetical protein